jgi:hypothetical protein
MYMEDLNSILCNAIDDIQIGLENKGVNLTESQVDELWDAITPIIEKAANYPDYRNYN